MLKEPEDSWQDDWRDYKSVLSFEIKHWKGCQHQNADALSCYPSEQCKVTEQLVLT